MSRRSMRASVTLVLLTASISMVSIGSHVSANESAGNGGRQSLFADFNGDGFSDLAVGVPNEDAGNVADAGAVAVIYGSPRGLTAKNDQLITQNTPGIADVAEEGDAFSWWLSSADFNGDGFSDLAAGAGAEHVDGVADAGAVHVIYGSPNGLTAAGDDFFTQNTPGISDRADEADCFGCTTGGGDLNGDGYAELLVGAQAEEVGSAEDAGVVHIIFGSARGLVAQREQFLSQNTAGVVDRAEAGDNFGWAFSTGDYGGSRHNDLAVGIPFEDVGNEADAGAVHVFFGSREGVSFEGDRLWTQNSPGVRDAAEAGDEFGFTTFAADVVGERHADLVVPAPGEDVGSAVDAGAVNVIRGSNAGLTGRDGQLWTQNSAGIADEAEEGDRFGDSVAAADLGKGPRLDLAVGADLEDVDNVVDAGAVNVIYGGARGLTARGDQFWSQNSPGVRDKAEPPPEDQPGESFGWLVFAGDFGRSRHADLAVTVPGEDVGGFVDAGAANVLYGSPSGLTARGDQLWTQNTPGIKDEAEELDLFGIFLAAPT
ncbi:MAG: hypothetical protein M3214_06980 [Actinomycetota bacterium]|nr:hypothetical protein [Actinomycetota bacterium]